MEHITAQTRLFDYDSGQRAHTLANDAYGHRQTQAEDAWSATCALRQCVRLLRVEEYQRAAGWFQRAKHWYERAGEQLHAATEEEAAWFYEQLNLGEGAWWHEGT